jgi:hypothetical protein
MTRTRYEIPPSAALVETARAAVGEQLPRYLPALREPPREMRELLARLVALDSVKRRAAESRVTASLPLQPPQLPQS